MRRVLTLFLLLLPVLLCATCGTSSSGSSSSSGQVVVTLSPARVNLGTGQSRTFQATVTNAASNPSVTWRVNGLAGGNAEVGTITDTGVYTAPNTVPSPPTVVVTAVSNLDPTVSTFAHVTITFANPVQVIVVPANSSVTVGQTAAFTAIVGNATNLGVTWQVNGVTGGTTATGTINGQGIYQAPAAVPSPATVQVTAVSQADSGKSGSATVTVVRGTGVSIGIAPSSATVATGSTQAFSATVANTPNPAVTWLVNDNQGGNATTGTIDPNGVYTAPDMVPEPPNVLITAASAADPTRSASAVVTVIPTGGASVTIQPPAALVTTGSSQQFTASVINSSNTGVTWQVNGMTGGNAAVGAITSSGRYTAPAAVPSPAVVMVTAVANADTSQVATSQVTIEQPTGVTITISPASATVVVTNQQQFTASVANAPDSTVSWEVNGVAGGDNTLGTIDGNGLYTAPAAVPTPATVSVTALSNYDPGAKVVAPTTITLSPSPAPATHGRAHRQ